jgi:hypothetical protein
MKTKKGRILSCCASAATALLLLASPAAFALGASPASAAGQLTFDTPRDAADALIRATEANDVPALVKILGPDGKAIVDSGDAVRDKNDRAKFAEKAKEKADVSVDKENPKRAILVVGNDDWPMPVPIVETKGKWRFDAKEGRREILVRRIGGNELNAISLLRGYVEAQREYASREHDGSGVHQYAQKFLSTKGKHDGLSWWDANGKPAGPIGDVVAQALAAGYTTKTEPYNGYYFRILTAQGPAAPKGARNYIVKGMMIGGFAAVAWPASYGVTGVQTFQVDHDGIVYQKDLGSSTSKLAPAIKQYNPDKSWTKTDDAP